MLRLGKSRPHVPLLRTAVVVAATVLLHAATVLPAGAYSVELQWTAVPGAAGYNIYVRYGSEEFGQPRDLGSLAITDGLVSTVVTDIPMGPTVYFAVSSYDGAGNESPRSNELSIDYATAAAVVDTDGDGLTDAAEDVDLDQVVDPGETDPNNPDSDGDGFSDGAEISAGTDPTDPASNANGVCGNGVVEGSEECDKGPLNSNEIVGACRTDCRLPGICGDADEDTVLSAADVILVLHKAVVRDATCVLCDTNGDGVLEPSDALRLLRAVVGLGSGVWCG